MSEQSPTHVLRGALNGDEKAREEAFDFFEDELRQIARWGLHACDAPDGHSILVTELIDRGFMAAVQAKRLATGLNSRRDFVLYARRCILNEIKKRTARRRQRLEAATLRADVASPAGHPDRADALVLVSRLEDWLEQAAGPDGQGRMAEAVTIFREVFWNSLRIELVRGVDGGEELLIRSDATIGRKTFAQAATGLGISADTASDRFDLIRERMRNDPAIRELLAGFKEIGR